MMEIHPSKLQELFKHGIKEILLSYSVAEQICDGQFAIREAWVDLLEPSDEVK